MGSGGTDPDNPFSQPEPEVLWTLDFGPGEFSEQLYYTVPLPGEYWWDPLTGELIPGGDQQVWQIDIPIDPGEAFLQTGTAERPVIYWLDVRGRRRRTASSAGRRGSGRTISMDDAVWDAGSELPRTWQELRYPAGHPYHAPGAELDRPGLCLTFQGIAALHGLGRCAGRHLIAGYPTLAINNGARHVIRGPWLGRCHRQAGCRAGRAAATRRRWAMTWPDPC